MAYILIAIAILALVCVTVRTILVLNDISDQVAEIRRMLVTERVEYDDRLAAIKARVGEILRQDSEEHNTKDGWMPFVDGEGDDDG